MRRRWPELEVARRQVTGEQVLVEVELPVAVAVGQREHLLQRRGRQAGALQLTLLQVDPPAARSVRGGPHPLVQHAVGVGESPHGVRQRAGGCSRRRCRCGGRRRRRRHGRRGHGRSTGGHGRRCWCGCRCGCHVRGSGLLELVRNRRRKRLARADHRHEVHRQPVLNHIQLTVPVLVCELPQLPQDVLREAEGGPELHSLAGAEAVGLVLALRPPRVVELGVWEHLPRLRVPQMPQQTQQLG